MRESVPHLLPLRRFNLAFALRQLGLAPHTLLRAASRLAGPSLALVAFGLAGCTGKTPGQVVLSLQTDMSMPEDVTKVKIEVKADGVSRYDRVFIVDPSDKDHEKIPATLSVVAGEKENETIELKVVALRELSDGSDEPRTLNKTVTTIPDERIAMLRVPMQWLCTDSGGDFIDDFGDGEYESACAKKNGKETACVAGGCEDVRVDSAKLPDFDSEEVFGGAEDPGSSGKCFPTEECFDVGVDVVPDSDCVVTFEPESDDIINFAILATTGGIGDCRSNGSKPCYVGLDKSRDFGWFELEDGEGPSGMAGAAGEPPQAAPAGRRFQLPRGVCDRLTDGRAIGVRASTDDACEVTKTPQYPTCGPWSSVGKKTEPPPPEGDADGDGVTTEEGDCKDNDNSIYPGALEACDEKDNDCNDAVDDNCVADLPFSHRVDFSALDDGFNSTENYAIYQAFDEAKQLDLDQKTITFTPGDTNTHYNVSIGDLDWDADLGELVPVTTGEDVSNCDDCFTSVPIGFSFNFYGTEYTTAFPSSNGYVTFGVGDETFTEDVEDFLGKAPRISAFWDDLDTQGIPGEIDDEVHYFSDETKLVVTYQNVQIFPDSGTSNTFQIVLFADGTIKISYDGMDDLDETSLVGITPGSLGGGVDCGDDTLTSCFGQCFDLQNDYRNCGECGTMCPSMLCFDGTCAPDVMCTMSAGNCAGLCSGACQLDTGDVCDGRCYGTCDGTCDNEDIPGQHCNGNCDGDCTGTCYFESTTGVPAKTCNGLCTGSCYADDLAGCGDPTESVKGACSFNAASVSDTTSCYDGAVIADYATVLLQCSGTYCSCTKSYMSSYVSYQLTVTPTEACESAQALRDTFMTECLTAGSCGDGCPAEAPAAREACISDEISACSYSDGTTSTYCTCDADTFICN